jgi:hypothetical protein
MWIATETKERSTCQIFQLTMWIATETKERSTCQIFQLIMWIATETKERSTRQIFQLIMSQFSHIFMCRNSDKEKPNGRPAAVTYPVSGLCGVKNYRCVQRQASKFKM